MVKPSVAFCYSTKDRVDLTRQTFPSIQPDRSKYHLFWVDGSETEEGKTAWLEFEKDVDGFYGKVYGGADMAILHNLSLMLEKGYDYVGLIENDVMLHEGWFDRVFGLFDRGSSALGVPVGSVSARCFSDRVLAFSPNSDSFAVMANVGAGMVLFSREAAQAVLDHFRTISFHEYGFWTTFYTGMHCPIPHEIVNPSLPYQMTADWSFEGSILSRGMVSLACAPSMAHNIDSTNDLVLKNDPVFNEPDWYELKKFLKVVKPIIPIGNYEPTQRTWVQQPHQIIKALPEAFCGSWKAVWSKHSGPFGLMATAGDESLSLPFYGVNMGVLIDTHGKEASMRVKIKNGTATVKAEPQPGPQWIPIQFQSFDGTQVEIIFDTPDITVSTVGFDSPQPWFQNKTGLRYFDLGEFRS